MARRKPKERADYGSGSAYQDAQGRWLASIRLGNGKRPTRRFPTEQAARAWLEEIKKQRDQQAIDVASAQTKFSAYADAWLARQRRPRPSTIASYRDLLEYYIIDFVEGVALVDLRKHHFDTMLTTLLEEEYAVSQIRNAINLAARILEDALAEDLVPKNYAALVRKDIPANPESNGIVLTVEQVQKLLAHAPLRYGEHGEPVIVKKKHLHSRFGAIYPIAVLLGLRKGEALGLHWSAVDLDKLTITIDQQVQYIKGAPVITPPKSKAAVRTLPITPAIGEMLKVQRDRIAAERVKLGAKWEDHDLVFPAELGKPKEPSNFLREFKGLLIAAELPTEIRFHDLRHTAATRAGDNDMEEYVIAAMLGHVKGNVTRKYARATLEKIRECIQAVEAIYAKKTEKGGNTEGLANKLANTGANGA